MIRRFFSVAIFIASTISAQDPWAAVPEILARIKPPQFPPRDFIITKYGARDGADASAAIVKAIEACSRAGGGRVVVPKGDYLTGPIRLRSHIDLHLEAGATLRFTTALRVSVRMSGITSACIRP